jgi:2-polyprenyl-6-methoxyphenol hydroxylase-like FAD-dependent oxidoreductase
VREGKVASAPPGFEAKADRVSAQIQGPNGETRTVDCRWLVGCNGAHSKSAPPSASIFAGGQYPQTFVLADLEVDRDLLRDRMYRFNAGTAGQSGGTTLAAVPVHGSLAATACPPSCRNPL